MQKHPDEGRRVRLISMSPAYLPVKPGELGTVTHVAVYGTYHVKWDNGREVGLVPDVDQWEYILERR